MKWNWSANRSALRCLIDFSEGDEVVLAEGTYQGTVGTFLHLRDDIKWADIREHTGSIRSHPVAWTDVYIANVPVLRRSSVEPSRSVRMECDAKND